MIIAGAGGAAHLPGMTAAMTTLPVFGVPVESKALSGVNSLYSIVQMPPGVPVGTLAIGKAGAINAALLAASVLALTDAALAKRLEAWRKQQTDAVAETPEGQGVTAQRCSRSGPTPPSASSAAGSSAACWRSRPRGSASSCHVFCPDPHSPAFDVVRSVTEADYLDMAALDRFAADVDVVTYEFENVPAETATFLSARKPVLPDPKVLATTQDRLTEKEFVQGLGIGTAKFAARRFADGLIAGARRGRPARGAEDPPLRLRRQGPDHDPRRRRSGAMFDELGGQAQILEAFVPFEREISVVAARGRDGADRKLRRDRERASRTTS